jgi:hypothetical protein
MSLKWWEVGEKVVDFQRHNNSKQAKQVVLYTMALPLI